MSLPKPLGSPQSKRNKEAPKHNLFLEIDLICSTEVMQQPTPATDFIRNFSDTSIIKSNNYLILVELVPTMFNPTLQGNLVEGEAANSLQPGDIITAQWIKPLEK